MGDTLQAMILHALLDRYESSVFFREDRPPTRRIMLRMYSAGACDFPFYDIEQSECRISVNRTVEQLARLELVGYSWMKGETGHILERIWLNPDRLAEIYQTAGRQPLGTTVDAVVRQLQEASDAVQSSWARDFLQGALGETQRRRAVIGSIPSDDTERRQLLTVLRALDNVARSDVTERVFSMRTFGDSKTFERSVRHRLLGILRRYLDNDDDVSDEDLLRQIGIVKYPEMFELCGSLSASFKRGTVDFNCLPSGGVLYSSDLSEAKLSVSASTVSVLTVENRANYIHAVGQDRPEDQLVIYHGGQYSPRKHLFLQAVGQALPGSCRWYHWGDLDYGGFLMLARLRREIRGDIRPFHMGAADLERYRQYTVPVSPDYADRLGSLLCREELADCRETIEIMIQKRIRLEQEAMLADGQTGISTAEDS